eukprot:21589-Eustigmatos_ZCMA.PRE.1
MHASEFACAYTQSSSRESQPITLAGPSLTGLCLYHSRHSYRSQAELIARARQLLKQFNVDLDAAADEDKVSDKL